MFHPKLVALPAPSAAGETSTSSHALCPTSPIRDHRGAVEAEAPGIPKPVAPDFGSYVGSAGKRIVRGHHIGCRSDVESQNGTKQIRQVLAAAERISTRASISQTEIEVAIGSEQQLPAVVIGKGLLRRDHQLL